MQFRNKQTVYNGDVYDSVAEVIFAKDLEIRRKAKDIKKWERQYKIDFILDGYLICSHYVDFLVHHRDGTKELVEIKGKELPVWKLKRRMLQAFFLNKKKNKKFRYSVIRVNRDFYK